MRIFVTGTRGMPNIPGGIEKHCEELYTRLAAKDLDIYLSTRSPYVQAKMSEWKGVKLLEGFAPRSKYFEAIIHTFISIIKARLVSPDIIHVHGVGPSILVPVARLLGFKVVMTNHGPDYQRQKWGGLAKSIIRLGEKLGTRFANGIIVISPIFADDIMKKYRRRSHIIFNGVNIPSISKETDYLAQIGVTSKKYILAVGRFVPEKGFHDLIDAYKRIRTSCNLVIVGDADHETPYSQELKKKASADNRIIFTGYISGKPLEEIYSHAKLFVLPSYHEGLPIVLLEALSYGLFALVSDIPANKTVGLPSSQYFQCGNITELREKIEKKLDHEFTDRERIIQKRQLEKFYNWDKIADQTISVYQQVLSIKNKRTAAETLAT